MCKRKGGENFVKTGYIIIILFSVLFIVSTSCRNWTRTSEVTYQGFDSELKSQEVIISPTRQIRKRVTLPSDYVLYLPLDENTGDQANDQSNNENDGDIIGAAWTDGKIGSALHFDGNDWIQVANHASLNPTSQLTIMAWIKADNWNNNGRILQKGEGDNQYHICASNSGGENVLWFHLSGIGGINYSPLPSNGNWHQIVGTYNGSTIKLYINGQEVATEEASGELQTTTDDLRIGAKTNDPADFFHGVLDEIYIFDRALSSDEISDLPHSILPPQILYPKGGETLEGIETIQWFAASDSLDHSISYDILYSVVNRNDWIPIASGLTTTYPGINSVSGNYEWDTSQLSHGTNFLIKIIARCSEGVEIEDVSNESFLVHYLTPPSISTNARTLRGLVTIQWTASIDSLNQDVTYSLYYSTYIDPNWKPIASGLVTTSYVWNTTNIQDGRKYKIKVVATSLNGLSSEIISHTFSIDNLPTDYTLFIFGLAIVAIIPEVYIGKRFSRYVKHPQLEEGVESR